MAEEVGGRHIEWQGRHSVLCDVVINCTSVGMHPEVDEAPLHPSFLKPGLVVFDTVYTPETTLLVKEARRAAATSSPASSCSFVRRPSNSVCSPSATLLSS